MAVEPVLFTKLFQCFILARRVNHYYWLHTSADAQPGKVSVENVQRIISRLSGLFIYKRLVNFEAASVRGNVERYDWGVIINVKASQNELWQRFTVMKELCHVLLDTPDDWSTDVVTTIRDLLQFSGLDGTETPETRSEKLAEVMAVELIYGVEDRRADKEAIDANPAEVLKIAAKRGIPAVWIERATNEAYLVACEQTWEAIAALPQDPTPIPDEVPRPAELDALLAAKVV